MEEIETLKKRILQLEDALSGNLPEETRKMYQEVLELLRETLRKIEINSNCV